MGRLGDMFRRWRGGPRPGQPSGDRDTPHPDDAWPVPLQGGKDARPSPAAAPVLIAEMDGHPDDWFFGAEPAPQPEARIRADTGTQKNPVAGGVDVEGLAADAGDVDSLFPAPEYGFREQTETPSVVIPEFPVDDEPEPVAHAGRHVEDRIEDPARRLALLRAARIIGHFDIPERCRRQRALRRLAAVIEVFPHGASVRAIENLAMAGASTKEVETAAAVKMLWAEEPTLWLARRRDSLRGRMVATCHRSLRHAMTWRLALRMVRRWPDHPAEDLLAGDLLDRWTHLRGTGHLQEEGTLDAFCSYPVFLAQAAREEEFCGDDDPFENHNSGWPRDCGIECVNWHAGRAGRSDPLRREGWRAPSALPGRALHPSAPQQKTADSAVAVGTGS